MSNALEFQINLSGNFSAALEKSNKELQRTEQGAAGSRHELELFEAGVGSLSGGLGGLSFNLSALSKGGSFFTFDLSEGIEKAIELVHRLIEGIVDLGEEMIQAAAGAQDLSLAIELDVGKDGAEQVDKLAASFGNSAFSPKQIKEALLPILEESGNTHSDQWNDLATAATDVATRRNIGVAGAKSALEALNDIELNPQRLRGSLKDLGIKQFDFYKDLGDLRGISAKAAEAMVKSGQIKSDALLNIALHQIQEREGGSLGNATNRGDETLGASLKRLATLKDTLFEGVAKSPGIKSVQHVLDHIQDVMTSGGAGGRLVGGLDRIFGALAAQLTDARIDTVINKVVGFVDYLTSPAGVKAIGDGFEKALNFVENIPTYLGQVVTAVELIGTIWAGSTIVNGFTSLVALLPTLASGAGTLVGALTPLVGTLGAIGFAAGSVYFAFTQINDALKELGGMSHVWDDFKFWVSGTSATANDSVNENSPAWKKARAAGVPAFASGGIVDGPTLALIGEAGPEAVVPLRGRDALNSIGLESSDSAPGAAAARDMARPNTMSVTFAPEFHLAGGNRDDVADQLQDAEQRWRIEFKKILDEAAASYGVSAA